MSRPIHLGAITHMGALTLLWSRLALAAEPTPQTEPSPEALVVEAIRANPMLASMQSSQAALQARAEVAGAWADPMVSVELSNLPIDSFDLGGHPMAGVQLRASQTLRLSSWSRLSREVGSARADASGFAVAESELRLSLAVRRAWWSLTRTRLMREITRSHLARAGDLLDAARIRYETGGLGQHAVLRLTVLRDKLTDDLLEFDRTEAELTSALNQALAREAGAAVETPARVEAVAPPEDAAWTELAQAYRPLLSKIDAERDAAQRSAKLARADAVPDPNVWVGYRIRTIESEMDAGTDLVSVGLGVPIPVSSGRKASGQRAAALEEVNTARSAHDAVLDGVQAEMASILARWQRAFGKAETYQTSLLPGALATLQTTRSDFTVGRAEFSSLFEAEVALLDLERAQLDAAVETHLQHAEATAVLGIDPAGGRP